jgi:hypothetical protein
MVTTPIPLEAPSMNTLTEALAPPKKTKTPIDPNVKVLRTLARAKWGNPNLDGCVTVAADGSEVYLTNTYALRVFDRTDPIAVGLVSFAPDGWSGTGSFTLRLRASGPNYGLTTEYRPVELDAERVAGLIARDGYSLVALEDWTPLEVGKDRFMEAQYVHPGTGERLTVRVNARYLATVVADLDDPVAYAQIGGTSFAPVVITSDGRRVGVIQPVRV